MDFIGFPSYIINQSIILQKMPKFDQLWVSFLSQLHIKQDKTIHLFSSFIFWVASLSLISKLVYSFPKLSKLHINLLLLIVITHTHTQEITLLLLLSDEEGVSGSSYDAVFPSWWQPPLSWSRASQGSSVVGQCSCWSRHEGGS